MARDNPGIWCVEAQMPGLIFDMEKRKFKADNYITIPGFAIVELGLSGNDLVCYSLIYGFTQDNETEFMGSLAYVASALNVTKQNAKHIIDRLISRGLVAKRDIFVSGVKFCRYYISRGIADSATGCCQNSNGGIAERATGGVANSATNNNSINISMNNNRDMDADGTLFPNSQKDKKQRGTAEPLCLFTDSRYNKLEDFAAQFGPDYAGVDLAYYRDCVADWSARRGKKMRDWIATARGFIRSDAREGKLQKVKQAGMSTAEIEYLQSMLPTDAELGL